VKATIKVRWLKNHGISVMHHTPRGISTRFESVAGSVSVAEAAAALGTHTVKIYRMIESGKIRAQSRSGRVRVSVAQLRNLRRSPNLMADGRKRTAA
jgi:excisionase family DNA binding protein